MCVRGLYICMCMCVCAYIESIILCVALGLLFLFFTAFQFAQTYRNLQNTNRRHLNVHEPLIYDAVWLTAEALNISLPTLSEGNLTLNSTQRNVDLISVLKSTLENNTYNGLTVRSQCCLPIF